MSSLGRRSLTKDKTSIEELLRQNFEKFVQDFETKADKTFVDLSTPTMTQLLTQSSQTAVTESTTVTPEPEIQNLNTDLGG